MQGSYGRRTKVLPPLQNRKNVQEKEKQLEKEVREIDNVLKTGNLKDIHGLIFTDQIKARLAEDLLSSIRKKHRLVSYGFKIWQIGDQPSMVPTPIQLQPSFKQKLDQISVQKIQLFDESKERNYLRVEDKWKVARISQNSIKKHQQYLNISTSSHKKSQLSYQSKQRDQRLTPSNMVGYKRIDKKVLTQPPEQREEARRVSLQTIEKMLKNGRGDRLISIWLPPRSYPQFYGVVVPSVTVTKSTGIKCRIRKYILFRQSITARLLEGLIQYLSQMFGVAIQKLELIVKREDFRNYFEQIGCKIQSWEGVNKIAISYSTALQK